MNEENRGEDRYQPSQRLSTCRAYRHMTTLHKNSTKTPLAETQKLLPLKITF